jgi:hypothetical protein
LDELSGLERKARLKRLSEQVDEVKQEISGKKKKKKAPADGDSTNAFGSEDTDFETDDPGADADSDEAESVDSGDDEDEDSEDEVEEEPKELPVFPDTLEVGDTTYEKINDKMTWKELNKLCSEEDVVMVHRESDDFMKVYEKEMNVKLPSGGIPDNLDIYQPVFVGEMRHMIVAASVYTEAVVFLQELKSTKDGDYAFDDETPMAFFVASSEENEEE